MKKTAKIALCIVLLVILLCNLAVIVLQRQTGLPLLDSLPVTLIQVTGRSMEPMLRNGDVIAIRQAPFESLETGDVIVFRRDGGLIVHEIVEKSGGDLVTRGLANPENDDPVSADEYRAKMICRLRFLSSVWKVCRSPVGFVLFAVLLALLIFGNDIFSALYKVLFGKKE